MNWNKPVADELGFFADGSNDDSHCAILNVVSGGICACTDATSIYR